MLRGGGEVFATAICILIIVAHVNVNCQYLWPRCKQRWCKVKELRSATDSRFTSTSHHRQTDWRINIYIDRVDQCQYKMTKTKKEDAKSGRWGLRLIQGQAFSFHHHSLLLLHWTGPLALLRSAALQCSPSITFFNSWKFESLRLDFESCGMVGLVYHRCYCCTEPALSWEVLQWNVVHQFLGEFVKTLTVWVWTLWKVKKNGLVCFCPPLLQLQWTGPLALEKCCIAMTCNFLSCFQRFWKLKVLERINSALCILNCSFDFRV